MAIGIGLVALAIIGNLLVYSSLDKRIEVLQLTDNVRAGELVTAEDLRVVEVDLDPTVPRVAAADMNMIVSQYARVYLAAGTLIIPELVQPIPLVADNAGVVAVEIRPGRVPSGIVERSQILVVVVSDVDGQDDFVTTGRVVSKASAADTANGISSISVEVSLEDAPIVAAGDDIRVALLDPANDPARASGTPTP